MRISPASQQRDSGIVMVRRAMPLKLYTSWFKPDAQGYSWGEVLELRLQNFPVGWQLRVELTPQRVRLDDDSPIAALPSHELVLAAEEPTGEDKKRPGVRKLSPASKFDGAPLPATSPTPEVIASEPCLLFDCRYGGGSGVYPSILPAKLRLPMPYAGPDEKILLSVKLTAGEGEPSEEIHGAWTIEFLSRRVPLARKLEDFLRWQSGLVYGPPRSYFDRRLFTYSCNDSLWGVPEEKSRLLRATATGDTGPCMTCSAFTNLFLAYWFNYHERYEPKEPSASTEACAAAHTAFLTKIKPRCSLEHKTTRACPAAIGNKWHWQAFYEYLQADAKEGDVYLCGTGGHAFLVMRFGPSFTVPRKYVFGSNDPEAENPCPPGIYQIHASGPGPGKILWTNHLAGKQLAALKNLMESWRTSADLHESGRTYQQIATALAPQFERVENEGHAGIKVFNGTNLTLMNAWIRPATVGESGSITKDRGYSNANSARFVMTADRIDSPSSSDQFDAWKLRADILDPATGWLIPDAIPAGFEEMRCNDCRPLRALPPRPVSSDVASTATSSTPRPG